jgi:hypothetical protein
MVRKRPLRSKFSLPARRSESMALLLLLAMAGLAIAGPSGLFAWSENLRLRDIREAHLAKLEVETAKLQNRSQMGVVHPDEVVVKLED